VDWAILLAILNYVPYLGPIVAGLPPFVDAFLSTSPAGAVIVTIFYAAVILLEGYLIVPLVMGRSMDLNATRSCWRACSGSWSGARPGCSWPCDHGRHQGVPVPHPRGPALGRPDEHQRRSPQTRRHPPSLNNDGANGMAEPAAVPKEYRSETE